MPNELIATLIKFLPTILFAFIVLLGIFMGFVRGFRKSSILLVHYLISLAVGFVAYFILSKQFLTMDLNAVFSFMGGEYESAHTIYDFIHVFMNQIDLGAYSSLTGNYYIQGVIDAFVGLAVNLACGIVCLIILPFVLRIIFRFFYFLFYSERKYKKNKEAEGEDYCRHRFLGMGVGLLRGAICATLIVSFLTSFFYIVAGGDYYAQEEEHEIQLLQHYGEQTGFDLNAFYTALKQSRNTGVAVVYEKIKINGKPLDYYYYDLYLSSNFKTYNHSSNDEVAALTSYLNATLENGAMATLSIRQELALVLGLVESLLECNVIKIENNNVVVDNDILLDKVPDITSEYVNESVFFSDILPLALIGLVDEIQKGNITIQPDIDKYIKDHDFYNKVREIDLGNSISNMLNAVIPLVKLLKVNETNGQIDFVASTTPDALLNFDPNVIEEVFTSLSEISLITDVIFPIGMGIAFNAFQTQLTEAGICTDDIDLTIIDWKFELKNLGTIYRHVSSLGLEISKLTDQTVTESGKTVQMQYLTDFAANEDNKAKLLNVVDSVMDSNLTSQLMLVMMKKYITDINLNTDGTNSELNASFQLVKDNLNARDENGKLIYNTTYLKEDLHTFVESCLGLFDLFSVFSNGVTDPMKLLKDVPVSALREALIGLDYEETGEVGGIYNIKFLSGDLDGDGILDSGMNKATDAMIETLLKAYSSSVFTQEDIDKVSQSGKGWPEELNSLIKCIEVIQENDELSNLSLDGDLTTIKISNDSADSLTESCSKSILLGSLITNKIKDALVGQESINIPENTEWLDTFDEETGNLVARGELNKMLKILNVFNDPKNGINLSDTDSIVSGLANLTRDEVNTLTASNVLTNSLSSIVSDMLEIEESKLDNINWSNDGEKDGELQTFINILNIESLKTENKFDQEKLTDVDTIAKLIKKENDEVIYTDAESIAKSQIIMTVISDKLSEISSDDIQIIIPEKLKDTDGNNPDAWKAWAHSEEGVYKDGEFIKMVYSLYCARGYVITIKDTNEQFKYEKLTTDNLIEGILGMPENTEDYSPVTESLVMYATLSNKLDELSKGDNPTIQIREEAYVKEADLALNNNIVIIKEEVSLALCTIGDLGLTDFNNVNTSTIIDNIKANSEVRRNLCNSNIMNKTIVDKLITNSSGTLKFPGNYSNVDEAAWYPTAETDSWELCELNLILNSIVELSSGDDAGIIINGDNITSNTNKLFKDLSNTASGSEDTKLKVIYSSEVMAYNISDKIVEQETNDTIEIRILAFEENSPENNLKYEEIELLVSFLNDNEFKIDNNDKDTTGKELNAEELLNLVDSEENREIMCTSNILNITIISKVTASESIKIPNELKDGETVNLEDNDWYHVDSLWSKGELNKLLVSINELELDVVGNDVNIDTENVVYDLNNYSDNYTSNKKIEIVYESLVMAQTISDYIIENDSLDIPTTYKTDSSDEEATVIVDSNNRIVVGEIASLVNSIDILKINLGSEEVDGKVKPSDLTPGYLVGQSEENIAALFSSAIISYKTSTILNDNKTVVVPTTVNFELNIAGQTETNKGIYCSDITALILAIKALDFNVDGDVAATFSLSEISVDTLNEELEKSSIFHATMSAQVTNNVTYVPKYYYLDIDTKVDLIVDFIDGHGEELYLSASEISNLVTILQVLGIDNANDATATINENFITSLDETKSAHLANSGIIAAMVTDQMISSIQLANTKHIYNKVDMYKTESNMNSVINGKEITALVDAINVLGIKDFTKVNKDFLTGTNSTEDDGHITVSKLLTVEDGKGDSNIGILLNSYTVYAMLSDSLIKQIQQINSDYYHIVTYTYHKDLGDDHEVTVTTIDNNKVDSSLDVVKFIEKVQITNLLEGLSYLGINEVSQASSINATILIDVAKDDNKISKVESSAILCTIMSNLLLHTEMFSALMPYPHYDEKCAALDEDMEILSFEDIHAALLLVRSNPLF